MTDVISWLFNFLQQTMKWVVALLPNSPFKLLDNSPIAQYLPWINWFIPFEFMVNTLVLWLVAVGGYYLYSVVLRWIKAVE